MIHVETDDAAHLSAFLARSTGLSDGIFAVAMTLLVLNLRPPDLVRATDAGLQQALLGVLPSAFTFVLSFVVVGNYWLSHHRLFQLVGDTDRGILYANLLFLLTVCFVPFPTSIVASYGDLSTAVVLYAASLAVTGAALTLLWWYATLRRPHRRGADDEVARYFTLRSLAVTCVFVVSIPIALRSPLAGRLFWLAILPVYVGLARIARPHVPGHLRGLV